MKGNIIIVLISICILAFLISWMIQIQVSYTPNKTKEPNLETSKLTSSLKRGKYLFKNEQCSSCHKPTKKDYIMRGITDKYSQEFLIAFIRNEDSLISIKHPDVIAIKEEYNWTNGLHNKKHLSKSQVIDILNYLSFFD